MHYYVMKTGLPMFDACRAYALALIIERLTREADAVEDVTIQDAGTLYLVDGPDVEDLTAGSTTGLFDDLLVPTDGWCGVLLTTGRTPREERLKPASRKRLENKIANTGKVVLDWQALLSTFAKPTPVELRSRSGTDWESIPASLDVAASKGIRRAKRSGYSEGEQLFAPQDQWAVGLIGGAHFIRGTWAGGNYVGLLATPQSVTMRDHHAVRTVADSSYLCGVSTATAAAHYAVQLVNALRQHRADLSLYADRYAALAVQTMTYSGSQWKAQTGIIFPLEYPMRLVESDLSISADVLDVWNHLFRWGSVRGNEMLALTLAEFLGQPSLETFERYARIHLRMTVTDRSRRPFPPYQIEWMKEVLRYV